MSTKIFHKTILGLLLISLVLPLFSFAQVEPPETLEEGKEAAEKGIKKITDEVPGIMKKIWREEAVPIWRKMLSYFRSTWEKYIKQKFYDLWHSYLKPKIKNVINRVKELIGIEIEKREPMIKEEFEKEKEEMKEEVPKVTRSLWERFKELLK